MINGKRGVAVGHEREAGVGPFLKITPTRRNENVGVEKENVVCLVRHAMPHLAHELRFVVRQVPLGFHLDKQRI